MRIEAYSQIHNLYQTPKSTGSANIGKTGTFRDSLNISGTGRDMQVAKEALLAAPDIREDKVAAIKAAYQSGQYSISAEKFAEKVAGDIIDSI